jgi:hypothetical protein
MTKSSKPAHQAPSASISFNGRSDAVRESRAEIDELEADIDTQELQALREPTDTKLGDDNATQSVQILDNNPYSTLDTFHTLSLKKPRRTLDDMRKLSEEIKNARADKKIS